MAGQGKARHGRARQGCFGTNKLNKQRGKTKMEYKETKKITKERIDEVLRIKQKKGLTAENLLDEAKKKSNPLHDLFEWDDTEAAIKWRLQQARVFINEIKIVIDTKEYYAFENVSINIETSDNEESVREYKSKTEILEDKSYRKQIVDAAYNQLLYWKSKYEQYNIIEFSNIIKEINTLKSKRELEA